MNKKNKAMLIAAIGAIVVLIASSAVRCAVSRTVEVSDGGSSSAKAESSQSAEPISSEKSPADEAKGGSDSGPSNEEAEDAPEKEILKQLRSRAWQAEGDSETTVAFRDGSFVESSADGVKVTAFEVKNAAMSEGHASLDVELMRDGEEPSSSLISIEKGESGLTVSCDGFANCPSYVEGSATEEPVSVQGVDESYAGLIDGKTDELAAAIASYCRDHVPTATSASFDGEVFLDIPGKRVTATFHCNDKASTILSVAYADGSFTVVG